MTALVAPPLARGQVRARDLHCSAMPQQGLLCKSWPPAAVLPSSPSLRFSTGFTNAITAAIWWRSISEIAAVSAPPGPMRTPTDARTRSLARARSCWPCVRIQTKPYGPLLFLHLPRLLGVAAVQLKDERSREHQQPRQHRQHLPFASGLWGKRVKGHSPFLVRCRCDLPLADPSSSGTSFIG